MGWFEGAVPTSECDELRAAIAGLGDASPDPPPPGAATETLELTGRDPLVVTGVEGHGPLGPLVDRARRLLDAMVDSPRAAVALEAGSPPRLSTAGPTRSSST